MRAENQEGIPLITEQETREGVLFLKPQMSLHQFLSFFSSRQAFDILGNLSPTPTPQPIPHFLAVLQK